MRKTRNWLRLSSLILLFILIVSSVSSSSEPASTTSTNLLVNPGFDNEIWHWFAPGHYVADGWWRWWIDGDFLPEWFPSSVTSDNDSYESQRWHAGTGPGEDWRAGLYQIVQVEPCVMYELSAWSRMHIIALGSGTLHHKVGLDPYGRQYTASASDAAVKDDSMKDIVYSDEQQNTYTWEKLSVQTEARNTQVSAVLYSKTERYSGAPFSVDYDSFYDTTSLVQVPFDDNRLPAPEAWTTDGIINNVDVTTATNSITITWETSVAASTQVWYDYFIPSEPGSVTDTMTYTVFAPYAQNIVNPESFAFESDYDTTPKTSHSVTITGIPDNAIVMFAPVSRYLQNNTCNTSGYAVQRERLP